MRQYTLARTTHAHLCPHTHAYTLHTRIANIIRANVHCYGTREGRLTRISASSNQTYQTECVRLHSLTPPNNSHHENHALY